MKRIFNVIRAVIHVIALTLLAPVQVLITVILVRKHRKEYKSLIDKSHDRFFQDSEIPYWKSSEGMEDNNNGPIVRSRKYYSVL